MLHLVVVFNKEVQLLLLRRREAVYRQLVEHSFKPLLSSNFFAYIELDLDWVNFKEMMLQLLHNVVELHLVLPSEDLKKLLVCIHISTSGCCCSAGVYYRLVLLVIGFLQSIGLDILPESAYYLGPALFLDAKDLLKLWAQLVLLGLVVYVHYNSAVNRLWS